jgi:hypothetical protein
MEEQERLRMACAAIQRITDRTHGPAAAWSRLESERLRQQNRANDEAARACEAEERLAAIVRAANAVVVASEDPRVIAGPLFDRIADLRTALSLLPNDQVHRAKPAGDDQ